MNEPRKATRRAARKADSRRRIVRAAARLMREKGLDGASVPAVMAEAGLTHGAFYAHFPDKTALAGEALGQANAFRERWLAAPAELDPASWLRRIAARYLSRRHLEAPGEGCPYPSLAQDFARGGAALRAAFEAEVRETETQMRARLNDDPDRALAALAMMVGAMTLARAVESPTYAERILAAARTIAPRLAETEPEGGKSP